MTDRDERMPIVVKDCCDQIELFAEIKESDSGEKGSSQQISHLDRVRSQIHSPSQRSHHKIKGVRRDNSKSNVAEAIVQ